MFRHVYAGQIQARERMKIKGVITALWGLYTDEPRRLPESYRAGEDGVKRAVCDYIAGMTDRFAMRLYIENFVPQSWKMYSS
jgi:dGTPase